MNYCHGLMLGFLQGVLVLLVAGSASAADKLQEQFASPPPEARPEIFWDWMHDMVTREGITHDLEAMKQAGFSGAMIMLVGNVDAGFNPTHNMPNPAKCMSPEFFSMWKFAAEEAGRLGLTLVSQCGPGWSHSGGPWIRPEDAVQQLAFSEVAVTGPVAQARITLAPSQGIGPALPVPDKEFTRDLAVVAFRSGSSQLQPEDILELTDHVHDGVLTWDVPSGKWVIRRYGLKNANAYNRVAPASGRGLECDKFSRAANQRMFDGMVGRFIKDSPALAGKSIRGMEADSWEVGKPEWSDDFRQEFKKRRGYDPLPWLVGYKGGPRIGARGMDARFAYDLKLTQADVFADNFFSYLTDRCAEQGLDFMTEPYEGPFDPVRCGGRTARPMGEFWATSDRMHTIRWAASAATTYGRKMAGAESFTGRWSDGAWGIDPYALKRIGDLAFCNGLNKMTLHGMALQPWADKVKPGMTMGFWGTMLCPGQTWWEPGKAWIAYLSRCQYLLQQGHMVADILWLLPSVNWADTIPGGLHKLYNYDLCSEEILLKAEIKDGRFVLPNSDAGYRVLLLPPNKGSMTPRLMKKLLELVNAGGTVVVGSGRPSFSPSLEDYPACDQEVRQLASELWGEYNGTSVKERRLGKGRLCVIPWGSERIDPEAEWVKQHRPAPQFYQRPAYTMYWSEEMRKLLRDLGAEPDCEVLSAGGPACVFGGREDTACGMREGEDAVAWTHRRVGELDIYFVASQVSAPMSAELIFRVTGKTPELWDPETGNIASAAVWRVEAGRIVMPIRFTPYGSTFVVFRPGLAEAVQSVTRNGQPCSAEAVWRRGDGFWIETDQPGTYEVNLSSGRLAQAAVRDVPSPIPFDGPWQVQFPAGRGAPAEARLALGSWTANTDLGIRYFSGTATYSRDFDLPADRLVPNRIHCLDLGQVKNLAEVVVNGEAAGILWKPPFRLDITRLLKPGKNHLEIKVTNLWLNRMVGDEQLPDDCQWMPPRRQCNDAAGQGIKHIPDWVWTGGPRPQKGRYTFTTWKFYNRQTPLLESGLLGPVVLETARQTKLMATKQ